MPPARTRSSRRHASSRRPPASFMGGRDSVRLAICIGLLLAIVAGYRNVQDPALWASIFPGFELRTDINNRPADVEIAQRPGPEPTITEHAATLRLAMLRMDEDEDTQTSNSASFNPLNLRDQHGCTTVDHELLEQLLKDKTGQRTTETPALYQVMCVAASTPPNLLAKESRRDIGFANLVHDPNRYRGTPIHVRGLLRTLALFELNPEKNPYGIRAFYEGWVFTEDQPTNPTRILFTELPEGLQPGDNLTEDITFDGYFVKLSAYRARDGLARFAPMLVGFRPTVVDAPGGLGDGLILIGSVASVFFVILIGYILWQGNRDRAFTKRIQTHGPTEPPTPPEFPATGTNVGQDPWHTDT